MATRSRAFGAKVPRKSHLVKPAGGVAAEVYDARKDVEEGFTTLEGRSGGYPELDWLDGASIPAAGGDIVLEGRNFLQGQTFDELVIGTGTSQLTITALKPGDTGITVEVTASGGGESISFAGGVLTIDADDGVTTANAIATLINADGADTDGILRCASGGTGTVHPPAAAAPLVGGAGEGLEVLISGVEALPANTPGTAGAAAVDDGTITCTVPDLTSETPARAATDVVGVTVKSDGVVSQQLSASLA